MAQLVSGLRCFSADFVYNDTSIVIAVPDGWLIDQVICEITTIFNGTGVVTVGYTAQVAAFLGDADITQATLGCYRSSEGVAAKANGYRLGAGEDALITVTVGTSTSGAGKVYVFAAPVA